MFRMMTWGMVALSLAGCGKDDAKADVSEHRYEIRLNTVNLPFSVPKEGATLVVNGKKRGLMSSSTAAELTVGKDEWLADAKLALLLPTTCGEQEVALQPPPSKYAEETHWKVSPDKPYSVSLKPKADAPALARLIVLIDNEEGDKPAKVQFGKTTIDVAAKGKARDVLSLGTCPEARKVSIDGKEVGEAFEPAKLRATLVDVAGGHCYRYENVVYAKKATGSGPKLETYAGKPGQHLLEVQSAGHFLERAPDKVTTTQNVVTMGELLRKPCK